MGKWRWEGTEAESAPKWQFEHEAWKAEVRDDPASATCSEKRKQSNTQSLLGTFKCIKKNKKLTYFMRSNCAPTCWLPFSGRPLCIQRAALGNTMKCLDSIKEPKKKPQANLGPSELAGKLLKASHKLSFVHSENH